MKKIIIVCMAVLLALSVCACSSAKDTSTYTVGKYVVDQENGTIFDGTYTYQYTFSGDTSGYSIEIIYPDGSSYWTSQRNSGGFGVGSGGWSDDYDADRYVDGYELCRILEAGAPAEPRASNPGAILFAIFVLGIGLFNVLSPQTAWYLSEGWKFKAAEPSDMALGLTRAGGVFAIIVGIIAFLAGLPG